MVQNIINISEQKDRVLNMVKAQHGLKNKSQAIELVLQVYGDNFLEPAIRPEYLMKLEKIQKQKGIRFHNIDELRAHIEKNA